MKPRDACRGSVQEGALINPICAPRLRQTDRQTLAREASIWPSVVCAMIQLLTRPLLAIFLFLFDHNKDEALIC